MIGQSKIWSHYTLVKLLPFMIMIGSYAQEVETVSFEKFEQIKDTTEYFNQVGILVNDILRRKSTMSIEDAVKVIQLGKSLDYNRGIGRAYRLEGTLYKGKLQYLRAKNSFEKAISYFEKANDPKGVAKANNDLFAIEYLRGNTQQSTLYLLASKKYHEQIKDSLSLATINNNLGAIYARLKNYKAAEQAFEECLLMLPKDKPIRSKGTIMSNLGKVYMNQGNYDKAEDIIKKAMSFNKENGIQEALVYSYEVLADIYIKYEQFNVAKKYNDSALFYFKQKPGTIKNIRANYRSARIDIELRNFDKARKTLNQSREVIVKANAITELLNNYSLSATLDSITGDFSSSLSWLNKRQKLVEQRREKLDKKKNDDIESNYKSELEQLQKINEEERKEAKGERELFVTRVFILIIAVLLLISLSILFSILKVRKERKKLILRLENSNHMKNKLFSIVSHDLKNEIFSLETSFNLIVDNNFNPEKIKEMLPLLIQRTHQTSILLHNLLNWSKSQMQQLIANPVDFDVTEVIISKLAFFKPKAAQKNIRLINNLESVLIHADKDMVGIIVQNLIANAIKFCEPGDSIALMSREKNEFYEIGVEDTGIGIDPVNINKLFSEDTFSTVGTQNESGTGLGLKICKELIELNKGNIKVESTLGKGTIFYISFPKTAA